MATPRFHSHAHALAFVLACFAPGCVVDEPGPAPAPESEPADDLGEDAAPLAELRAPTADGAAEYVFKFFEADGDVATFIGIPDGYPAPEVDGDCALDIFLRVAADDAIVPAAVRRACGDHDPAERRAADLRPTDLTLQTGPITAISGPFCTTQSYATRYAELLAAAAWVPHDEVCTHDCVSWGVSPFPYCLIYENDVLTRDCTNAEWIWLQNNIGESGFECEVAECHDVPRAECDHLAGGSNNYGPWVAWVSQSDDKVSKLQAEFSNCAPTASMTVSWKRRKDASSPWSAPVSVVLGGGAWWKFQLDSGTSSGGNYLGRGYYLTANGAGVTAMWVAAAMGGISRSECPSGLPL
jgi:hypothetical protein